MVTQSPATLPHGMARDVTRTGLGGWRPPRKATTNEHDYGVLVVSPVSFDRVVLMLAWSKKLVILFRSTSLMTSLLTLGSEKFERSSFLVTTSFEFAIELSELPEPVL